MIERPVEKIVRVDISGEKVMKFEKQLDEMKTMARDAEAALEEEVRRLRHQLDEADERHGEEVRALKHQLDEQKKRCEAAEEEVRTLQEKLENDMSDTSG